MRLARFGYPSYRRVAHKVALTVRTKRPYFDFRGAEILMLQGSQDVDDLSIALMEGNLKKVYNLAMDDKPLYIKPKSFEIAKLSGFSTSMLIPLTAVSPRYSPLKNKDLFVYWCNEAQNMDTAKQDWLFGKILDRAVSDQDHSLVERMMRCDTYGFLHNDEKAFRLLDLNFIIGLIDKGIQDYPCTMSAIHFVSSKFYVDPLKFVKEAEVEMQAQAKKELAESIKRLDEVYYSVSS
ncbi:MAG: hypothetical protein JSS50_02430 [Proteobacteria bacterium]|nr:hypothetical protein [Pseudomonadota bacterium]